VARRLCPISTPLTHFWFFHTRDVYLDVTRTVFAELTREALAQGHNDIADCKIKQLSIVETCADEIIRWSIKYCVDFMKAVNPGSLVSSPLSVILSYMYVSSPCVPSHTHPSIAPKFGKDGGLGEESTQTGPQRFALLGA